MGHFLDRKLIFWRPRGSILGTLGHHFGDPGVQAVTQQALGGPGVHFYRFYGHLGSLLGPTLATILWFSVIWGGKMGDSFQVHVFGDPGMEMMPECNGCVCYKHNKNNDV